MNTDFPDSKDQYIKAERFQDQEVLVSFQGWDKKANEDDAPTKKNARTWKQKLKYQLRYSYPEWAVDETGEKIMGSDGEPFRNRYFDPTYPQGYSIIYYFSEGTFESGSLPLWRAFCQVKPKPGNDLLISRTGKDKETKWFVKKAVSAHVDDVPEIDMSEGDETPFEPLG